VDLFSLKRTPDTFNNPKDFSAAISLAGLKTDVVPPLSFICISLTKFHEMDEINTVQVVSITKLETAG